MSRYGMIIDVNKCNGCYNCFLACKDEYTGNEYPTYSAALPNDCKPFMKMIEKEMGVCPKVKVDYVAMPCLQCQDAQCVKMATDGEVYRRDDGIVIIDPEKAKGKREIVTYCPHRFISYNEAADVAQKCTFCAHLLDRGAKEPRCVEACPSGAILFGDLDDPNSEISKGMAAAPVQELNASYALKPNVVYRSLPGKLIAGDVVFEDKENECASGVKVTLKCDDGELSTTTDFLGEFEFKALEADKCFTLTFEYEGYKSQTVDVKTDTDKNIGEVLLTCN